MKATVHRMANYRLVFVLRSSAGTVVFLATHSFGRGDRRAHEQVFSDRAEAVTYASVLAHKVGCNICGLEESEQNGSGGAAHG